MKLKFASLIDAGVLDHLIHAPQRCCSLWCGRESKVFLSLRAPRLAFGSWCVKQPIGGPSFGSTLYLRGQGREENMKQQVGRVLPLKHIQKRIYDSLTMLKWLNILSEMVEYIDWIDSRCYAYNIAIKKPNCTTIRMEVLNCVCWLPSIHPFFFLLMMITISHQTILQKRSSKWEEKEAIDLASLSALALDLDNSTISPSWEHLLIIEINPYTTFFCSVRRYPSHHTM